MDYESAALCEALPFGRSYISSRLLRILCAAQKEFSPIAAEEVENAIRKLTSEPGVSGGRSHKDGRVCVPHLLKQLRGDIAF